MLVNRINKIIAGLLILAAGLVSVSYADHPTAGDQAVSDHANIRPTYLSRPGDRHSSS